MKVTLYIIISCTYKPCFYLLYIGSVHSMGFMCYHNGGHCVIPWIILCQDLEMFMMYLYIILDNCIYAYT